MAVLSCYDPATKKTWTAINHFHFPNGICVSHDGKSVLIASTPLCQVFRYWVEGPRKGELELLIDHLPGIVDNINRASDGNYWVALVGIRSPAFDLAMRKPGFRLRMVKQVPTDEWLAPGLNHGCVLKFTDSGEVLESYWDPTGVNPFHPDLDARAQGLSLSWRAREQPDRPHQARQRRSDLDRIRGLLGRQAAGPGVNHGRLHLFLARCRADRVSQPGSARHSSDGRRLYPERSAGRVQSDRGANSRRRRRRRGRRRRDLCLRRASRYCACPATATRRAQSLPSSKAPPAVWPFIRMDGCWSASPAAASPRSTPAARQTWLNQAENQPLQCLTSVAAAADGSIFMTDGSSRNQREDWVRDLMEKNHLGRLIACGPGLDGAKCLLRDLYYPHGVADCGRRQDALVYRKLESPDQPRRYFRRRHRDAANGRRQHAGISGAARILRGGRVLAQRLRRAHASGRVRAARGRFPPGDDGDHPAWALDLTRARHQRSLPRADAVRLDQGARVSKSPGRRRAPTGCWSASTRRAKRSKACIAGSADGITASPPRAIRRRAW